MHSVVQAYENITQKEDINVVLPLSYILISEHTLK